MSKICFPASVVLLTLLATVAHSQNKRDIAVRADKQLLSDDAAWIYDDLPSAIDEATKTKRPLMVVFR